jgi:hypothetical protein
MSDFDPRSTGAVTSISECTSAGGWAGPVEGNHALPKGEPGPEPTPQTAGNTPTGSTPDDRSGLDRAEEVVDHIAGRVSSLTSSWGRKFLRLGSRARESLQDFWAEVQDFRQGKKP